MEHPGVVVGTCMSMCSKGEMIMREQEGLLHRFEAMEGSSCHFQMMKRKSFGTSPSKLLPKANPNKVVKEYSRSAAGRSDLDPCNIRPAPVLKQTMLHLLNNVAVLEVPDWTEVFDFIFDRIRAVRQDMTIQGIAGKDAITILEQSVRFHSYASYRLRECGISEFDPVINKHHLLECLKELLCLYQTTDDWHENQPEFEAVYLCDNLGNEEAISHYLSLPSHIRNHPLVLKCYRASASVLLRNYARALRLIHSLKCSTCLCVVSYHLNQLRIGYLQTLSHGYSVKNCQFPIGKLSELLHLLDATATENLCTSCCLVDWFSTPNGLVEYIAFNKTKFSRPTERKACPHISILEQLLSSSHLSNILANGLTERVRDGGGGVGVTEFGKERCFKFGNKNNSNHGMDRQEEECVEGIVSGLESVSLSERMSEGDEGDREKKDRLGMRGVDGRRGKGVIEDRLDFVGGVKEGRRGEKEEGGLRGIDRCGGRGRGKVEKSEMGDGVGVRGDRGRGKRGRRGRGVEGKGERVEGFGMGDGKMEQRGEGGIESSRGKEERIGEIGGEVEGGQRVRVRGMGNNGKSEGGGVESSKRRGRGRGRGRRKEDDLVKIGKSQGEGKNCGDEKRDGQKVEEEEEGRFSWEEWSERDFSFEMKEKSDIV